MHEGWPFAALAAVPASPRGLPLERALVICDEAIIGRDASKAVSVLRGHYPSAIIIVACDPHGRGLTTALACGADEILDTALGSARLRAHLSGLRERALAASARTSADGGLLADVRSRRAFVRARGAWKDLGLTSADFELTWLLLEREGVPSGRESLLAALGALLGREPSLETLSRRVRGLKKALAPWGGELESRPEGVRLVSSPGGGPRRKRTRSSTSRPS